MLLLAMVACDGDLPSRPGVPGSVVERQLASRAAVQVQAHVTGDSIGQGSVPAALGDDEVAALAALGYMDEGEELLGTPTTGTGTHDAERTASGWNFYSLGGQPEARLIDMDGVEVHRWRFAIADAWPGLDHPDIREEKTPWRRAQLLENGDVIGIWSGFGIVRIDADSRLQWAHWLPVHHDLHVYPDGRILTLTAHTAARPTLSDEPIVEDRLTWLSADGYPERSVSVLDGLMAHPAWNRLWRKRTDRETNDVLHTNTVFVLERDHTDIHPAFVAGRVLVSMRALSALALLDPDSGEVVWVHRGRYRRQHDPQLTPDGRLWVFDNQGAGPNRSRML
ncbi:MAG: arylsulfotransferase family protein, partial [Myxococcota bacterium]|nr:arylsulfotransferase family protein [Myxococcota bacterium]